MKTEKGQLDKVKSANKLQVGRLRVADPVKAAEDSRTPKPGEVNSLKTHLRFRLFHRGLVGISGGERGARKTGIRSDLLWLVRRFSQPARRC